MLLRGHCLHRRRLASVGGLWGQRRHRVVLLLGGVGNVAQIVSERLGAFEKAEWLSLGGRLGRFALAV